MDKKNPQSNDSKDAIAKQTTTSSEVNKSSKEEKEHLDPSVLYIGKKDIGTYLNFASKQMREQQKFRVVATLRNATKLLVLAENYVAFTGKLPKIQFATSSKGNLTLELILKE